MRIIRKFENNLKIYKSDIKKKGLYWSIMHRLYRIPKVKVIIMPVIDFLKPSYVMLDNQKCYIDKKDHVVSQLLLESGGWEDYERLQFKKHIKKGDVVVDIGAHIGIYTLLASAAVGGSGKVFAFEPDSRNFSILQKNITENNIKNVFLINKAVNFRNKKEKLYICKENTGDHRLYKIDGGKNQRDYKAIQSISLDDFFKDFDSRINIIKMDIQGFEAKALKGAKNIIIKNKDMVMFTEFWPKGLKMSGSSDIKYYTLLKKHGFKLICIDEENRRLIPIASFESLSTVSKNFSNLLCYKE